MGSSCLQFWSRPIFNCKEVDQYRPVNNGEIKLSLSLVVIWSLSIQSKPEKLDWTIISLCLNTRRRSITRIFRNLLFCINLALEISLSLKLLPALYVFCFFCSVVLAQNFAESKIEFIRRFIEFDIICFVYGEHVMKILIALSHLSSYRSRLLLDMYLPCIVVELLEIIFDIFFSQNCLDLL